VTRLVSIVSMAGLLALSACSYRPTFIPASPELAAAGQSVGDDLVNKGEPPVRTLVLDPAQARNSCLDAGAARIEGRLSDADARELNQIAQAIHAGPVVLVPGDYGTVRVQTGVECGPLSGHGLVMLFRRYRGPFPDQLYRGVWSVAVQGEWMS